MNINTIIFDFGGVIVRLSSDEAVKRFRELGLADAQQRLDKYHQSGIFGGDSAVAVIIRIGAVRVADEVFQFFSRHGFPRRIPLFSGPFHYNRYSGTEKGPFGGLGRETGGEMHAR